MITESVDSRSAALAGRLALLNTGPGRAHIRIYGGARAAAPAIAPTTPLLVAIELQAPAGAVVDGVLTLLAQGPATAVASGRATWARVVNAAGATAFDMDAGPVDSVNSECILSSDLITAGGSVSLISATLE